jgi:hypothetical protein
MSEQPEKRGRGGQPGNQNARTSGFYSKLLPSPAAKLVVAIEENKVAAAALVVDSFGKNEWDALGGQLVSGFLTCLLEIAHILNESPTPSVALLRLEDIQVALERIVEGEVSQEQNSE